MLIIDQIKKKENFTPTENQLAEYIIAHNREVMNMSLDEFSQKAYVSKSTIIRFCKKLGYKGHKELCVELAREGNSFLLQEEEPSSILFQSGDDRVSVADRLLATSYRAMTETFQDLNNDKVFEVAQLLHDAPRILVYGIKSYYPIALDFQQKLVLIQKDASAISSASLLKETAYTLRNDSVVVLLSYEGRNEELIQAAQVFKEKGISILLITGPTSGPLQMYANYVLRTQYNEKQPSLGRIGSITGMGLLTNLLYAYIFSMDHEKNMSYMHAIEESGM